MASKSTKVSKVEDTTHTLASDASNKRRPDGRVEFKLIGGKWNGSLVTLYPPFDEPLKIGEDTYWLHDPISKRGKGRKFVYVYDAGSNVS